MILAVESDDGSSFTCSRRCGLTQGPQAHGTLPPGVARQKPRGDAFVSGQLPIEVPSGRIFKGDIKRQAEIALGHVRNIVMDAKFSVDEIAKVTIYLTDLKNYEVVNEVYRKLFVGASLPARAVLQVAGLPQGVAIEVEAIAVKSSSGELFSDDELR
ncbi:MAG: RidA family protein [Myxococcota bacterium]